MKWLIVFGFGCIQVVLVIMGLMKENWGFFGVFSVFFYESGGYCDLF